MFPVFPALYTSSELCLTLKHLSPGHRNRWALFQTQFSVSGKPDLRGSPVQVLLGSCGLVPQSLSFFPSAFVIVHDFSGYPFGKLLWSMIVDHIISGGLPDTTTDTKFWCGHIGNGVGFRSPH